MRKRAAIVLLVGLPAMGCGILGPDAPHVAVRMDADAYVRPSPSAMATVTFQITNDGSATAYLGGCGERLVPASERRVAGRWAEYTGTACLDAFGGLPLVLAPGETRAEVWGWDLPGTYRLRVYYGDAKTGPWARNVVGDAFELR